MSTAAPTSEELRESKKAEAEHLAVRLHRQLAKLEPEKFLWRVEFIASTSEWSTNMLRAAWNPNNKTLLYRGVYEAVLEICDAPDSVRKTFDNWFKAGRLPPQLNERLLSVIVTILEEKTCGEADVDYDRVEDFVNRFRLLIERRVSDDSEDRLAKRLLAHVAARRNEVTRLHSGAASPMLDALLGELAATERVILAGIAGDETLQPGERASVA
ncbi:hypothetical protein OHS58_32420 [Amycolatopsis sp. NBC_00348]|uniref:hypothetical protein n=1 Tax=Amycolatopsis sp. NBC_00348 TaxID=2975956 RepID=UPI002E26AA6D